MGLSKEGRAGSQETAKRTSGSRGRRQTWILLSFGGGAGGRVPGTSPCLHFVLLADTKAGHMAFLISLPRYWSNIRSEVISLLYWSS